MDDQEPTGQVTRLGPESGGRLPGQSPGSYREWSWTSDELSPRRGLPVIGIFIIAFGVLLLLERVVPGTSLWSWLSLAGGVAALVGGASRRSAWLLQFGILLIAVGLPSLLQALGLISGPGWGTLFLGLALLGIGLARRRPRPGWQVWVGGFLALVGLSQTVFPNLDQVILPLAIVLVGGIVVGRALLARSAA